MTAATTVPAYASAPLPRGLALILRFLAALLHSPLGRCLPPGQICRICKTLAGTTTCPYALALKARPAPTADASKAAARRRTRRSHAASTPVSAPAAAPPRHRAPCAGSALTQGAPAPAAPPRAPPPRPPPWPSIPPRQTQRA